MGNRCAMFVVIAVVAGTASADVIVGDAVDPPETRPPGEVRPAARPRVVRAAYDEPAPLWGGGVRMTGLSGIGALPGRNYGGELAVHVRHDEVFGELALGRVRPEKSYVVVGDAPAQRTELGLDTWTARAGWASRTKPLRAWGLAEVGELANPEGMFGGIARMVTMQMPAERRWVAVGAGFGVAWPFSSHGRLVGALEVAVPLDRSAVMTDRGPFEPDPAVARTTLGLEVGWK
ncbi:MAG: hypothetical protein KIT31_43285 [Deltaproteobacteria bacterium]|nr:hypothetical protein [Deltaproteobacteria bacterium]